MDQYDSLLQIEFLPVAEVKAKLSEQLRRAKAGTKIAITQNGRPTAVLLSFEAYRNLLAELDQAKEIKSVPVLEFDEWQRDSKARRTISREISNYFDAKSLSRKGQKPYKRKKVRNFAT